MAENVARLVRENAMLRRVAVEAARVRRMGLAMDGLEENMEKVWREDPEMTRSATGMLMAGASYQAALNRFDTALLECGEMFLRDPFAEEISLTPEEVP